MLEFLKVYVSCLFAAILFLYSGKKLFKNKERYSNRKLLFSVLVVALLTSIFDIYGINIVTSVMKIMLVFLVLCVYYFYIFNINISRAITGAFLTYSSAVIAELVFGMMITTLSEIFSFDAMIIYNSTILVNFIIYGSSILIVKFNDKRLLYLIENSGFNKKFSSTIIVIVMFTIGVLEFRIPLSEWKLTVDFIITMIVTLCFCLIGIYILIQKSEIRKTTQKYQELVNYSDITNKLLEDYRLVSHEHKNQLSIIRGMLDNKNKELVNYVEDLLDKRNLTKYKWVEELNHLPLSGLKGLLNYKLVEMEKNKITTNILISKEVSKIKLNQLTPKQKDNLYSIMGVYLDNAIQACRESKNKEISLEIYVQKKEVVIVLANTYKGKILLNEIDTYGYSTKGKNRGVGLHLVSKILEEEKMFSQKRNLFKEYYVQELRINLNK